MITRMPDCCFLTETPPLQTKQSAWSFKKNRPVPKNKKNTWRRNPTPLTSRLSWWFCSRDFLVWIGFTKGRSCDPTPVQPRINRLVQFNQKGFYWERCAGWGGTQWWELHHCRFSLSWGFWTVWKQKPEADLGCIWLACAVWVIMDWFVDKPTRVNHDGPQQDRKSRHQRLGGHCLSMDGWFGLSC